MTAQMLEYPPAFVEASYLWVPPGRRGTYGPEVVDFTASLGHPVDAEQAQAIDCMASYGPGGLWHTFEVAIVEGRQNGKSDRTILPITMYSFFVRGVEHIGWTAQLMKTTKDVFLTVTKLIDANASLSRRVKEISESKSEVAIELMSGAKWEFGVRSPKGGRGEHPYDELVMDEALYITGAQMAARMPTLSSRANPQIRYASSPAVKESDHLRKLVKRGRAYTVPGQTGAPNLTWVEYCAPGSFKDPGCLRGPACTHVYGVEQGCVLDDESRWHLSNHRMGRSPGISYAFVRNERETLPVVEFARERGGWHEDGPDSVAAHPLTLADHQVTTVLESPPRAPRPAFFITIGADNGAVIAVASDRLLVDGVPAEEQDRRPHVELAANRSGSAWLAKRLEELAEKWPGARFGAGAKGPVKALVDAGKLPVPVELISPAEMAQACRLHEQLAKDHGYTHSPDAEVEQALRGAVSKRAGDGLWLWDWYASTGLAPLAAESGALYLLDKHRLAKTSEPASARAAQDDDATERTDQLSNVRALWRPTGRLDL